MTWKRPSGSNVRAQAGHARLAAGLLWTSVALIAILTAITAADGPRAAALAGQAALLALFASLAIVDFRAAAAIALLELVMGGSNGQWTTYPGGIHGRIVLDAIVMARVAADVAMTWHRTRRLGLGRYGPHAVLLSLALPAVWMTIGLIGGNRPHDVFSDGNAEMFFAFTLVFVALCRAGDGPWVRRWILIACSLNAVLIGLLTAISITGLVSLEPTLRVILWDRLGMGNSIGYLPNGAYRLFLASGLFLQVGIAAATWELVARPRSVAIWSFFALLSFDLVATYTRGFWVGALVAFVVVIVFGSDSLRRGVAVVGGVTVLFVGITVAGYAVRFSLPDYLLQRAATVVSTEAPLASPGTATSSFPAGFVPTPPTISGTDTSGEVSNAVRAEQARVLLGHIIERPLMGWGFGTIAPDYRYGTIPSYELAYLDLLYKTGVIGLLLWLSLPGRLLFDLARARTGRLPLPDGLVPRAMSLPAAVIISVMVTGATNPYMLASYGLLPILWGVAWLEHPPAALREQSQARVGRT